MGRLNLQKSVFRFCPKSGTQFSVEKLSFTFFKLCLPTCTSHRWRSLENAEKNMSTKYNSVAMNLVCAEDGLGKGVQKYETRFEVQKDCFDKTRSALFCSTALVVILQQVQVDYSLFLSIYITIAEQRD